MGCRTQGLCQGRGGRPGLPVANSPYGLCRRKVTLNLNIMGCTSKLTVARTSKLTVARTPASRELFVTLSKSSPLFVQGFAAAGKKLALP